MSICKSILKKEIYDLELDDLTDFFSTEQEETSLIEFKSGKVELEVIYKEVAAFLNTEGGVLIIGAPEEKTVVMDGDRKKKVSIGNLTPSKYASQDTLMSKIASNISPSPAGIKIRALPFASGYVYVLQIDQSYTPPHQVNNEGKYYIRLEREAKPAPHGIVEALFQKRQKPNLESSIAINTRYTKEKFIEFKLMNESTTCAESIGVIVDINGVKKMVNDDTKEELPISDEYFQFKETLTGQILVRGLESSNSFLITPTSDLIFVSFCYYCKDGSLEWKACIYDFETDQFIRKVDSKTINDPNSLADLAKEYDKLRLEKIKPLIDEVESEYKILNFPATDENITNTLVRLNLRLPFSYRIFLKFANGMELTIQPENLVFYSSDKIQRNRFKTEDTEFIVIGESNFEYLILAVGPDNIFGMSRKNEIVSWDFYPMADTFEDFFFKIIESIKNGGPARPPL